MVIFNSLQYFIQLHNLQIQLVFNPFAPNAQVFCFQGEEKGSIGNEWVKQKHQSVPMSWLNHDTDITLFDIHICISYLHAYMGQSILEWTKYHLWKKAFKKLYLIHSWIFAPPVIYINKYMYIYIISIHVFICLILYESSITHRFNETHTYSITNTYWYT